MKIIWKDCTMTPTRNPGWLDGYANSNKTRFGLPPGSVEAHCHAFGPGNEFPFAAERKYTPSGCIGSSSPEMGLTPAEQMLANSERAQPRRGDRSKW